MRERIRPTEESAQRELDGTEVAPGVARFLSIAFFVVIAAPGAVQLASELSAGRVLERLGTVSLRFTREGLRAFERDVDRASPVRAWTRPWLQQLLLEAGGTGNEKVVAGRDGRLFYEPGVQYLVGRGFLRPGTLAGRLRTMVDKDGQRDPRPDARPALIGLARDVARLGIRLTVVPIPEKAMLEPWALTRRLDGRTSLPVPNNPDFGSFAADLEADGIDVVNVSPAVVEPARRLFLAHDSHWTPEFMEDAARLVASRLRRTSLAGAASRTLELSCTRRSVSGPGDLVALLQPARPGRLFPVQSVSVCPVVDASTGRPFAFDPEADVLLAGDSFLNVYSDPSLGWGEAAGFGEQLARFLGRSVDRVAFNGAAAHEVRVELARLAVAGRLVRTRALVYEFAMRDLASADWSPVRLADSGPPAPSPVDRSGAELVVTARVLAVSAVPRPGTAPYRDCLTFVKFEVLSVESGRYDEKRLLAALWGMKNDVWLPAASFVPGDRVRLRLMPLAIADSSVRSARRADDVREYELEPFFAEVLR